MATAHLVGRGVLSLLPLPPGTTGATRIEYEVPVLQVASLTS